MKKKLATRYPKIDWLGTCVRCGETNLATQFGDQIIEGQPVCVACTNRPPATERSEGARTSDSASAVAP